MCGGFILENKGMNEQNCINFFSAVEVEETVLLMFSGFSVAGSATADDLTGSEVSRFRLPLSHQR